MQKTIAKELISQAIFYMQQNLPRIETCLNQLTEEEIWQKPNTKSNSIGNLVLHLCGNITQYIISSLGRNEDLRQRNLEFSTTGGFNKSELLSRLNQVVDQSVEIIAKIDVKELLRERNVQGFHLSGIGIIIHVVEHFSYHTGQIAFHTKYLKNKDLGFYDGIDLNSNNG